MVSIICCFNNRTCLEEMLLSSIKKQNHAMDLVLVDNTEGKYTSIARAYNDALKKATGDVIIFCHQDVAFEESDFIEKIYGIIHERLNIILGLAGISNHGEVHSNLKYYKTRDYITRKRVENDLMNVESVDECFFAISRKLIDKEIFDEKTCDNWHLYAVDLCYSLKDKNVESVVTSLEAFHKMESGSGLETDDNFLKTINKICKKYRGKTKTIYAPCYVVKTDFWSRNYKILKTKIKRIKNRKV